MTKRGLLWRERGRLDREGLQHKMLVEAWQRVKTGKRDAQVDRWVMLGARPLGAAGSRRRRHLQPPTKAGTESPSEEDERTRHRGQGRGPLRPGSSRSRLSSQPRQRMRRATSPPRPGSPRRTVSTTVHSPAGERAPPASAEAEGRREPTVRSRKPGGFLSVVPVQGAYVTLPLRRALSPQVGDGQWRQRRPCGKPACLDLSGWLQMGPQQGWCNCDRKAGILGLQDVTSYMETNVCISS